MDWRHAAVIADAAACGAVSWDSESRAGEMLQPAGYRPAGAWVRAGAGLRGAGGSVGMSCVRFALVLRFWRGVLCSSCACHTFSIGMSLALDLRLSCGSLGMSYVRSRLLFAAWRQTERLAGGCVSIPPWGEIAGSAFSMAVRLSGVAGSLRACTFLCGDPDGGRRDEETGNGVGGAVWARFCVDILAL